MDSDKPSRILVGGPPEDASNTHFSAKYHNDEAIVSKSCTEGSHLPITAIAVQPTPPSLSQADICANNLWSVRLPHFGFKRGMLGNNLPLKIGLNAYDLAR